MLLEPITKNVKDASTVFQVIAGQDPLDSTTIKLDSYKFNSKDYQLKGKTVGVIKELNNSRFLKSSANKI